MTIWQFSNFTDDAPHWDTAYIEAETEEEARAYLRQYADEDFEPYGNVWGLAPEERWSVKPAERPLRFVLGGGCR